MSSLFAAAELVESMLEQFYADVEASSSQLSPPFKYYEYEDSKCNSVAGYGTPMLLLDDFCSELSLDESSKYLKTHHHISPKRCSSSKQSERNMKQRERKKVHLHFFALLKKLLITTSLVKVIPKKGIRGFTQHDILSYTRQVIEQIISENPQLQKKPS